MEAYSFNSTIVGIMRLTKIIFTSLLVSSSILLYAQNCESGYASGSGISGINAASAWTNLPGVQGAPDGSVTSIVPFTPLVPGGFTSRIGAWGFGIEIPCNAVVTDVTFDLVRRNNSTAGGNVRDMEFILRFPDFSFSTLNGGNPGIPWANQTTGFETVNYSEPSGWGVTLTPEIVNDPLFGVIFTVENVSTTADAFPEIDAIQLNVCYTVPTTPFPPIVTEVIEGVDDLCPGGGLGVLTINATGGSGDFEYSIDNGATYSSTNVFSGLQTGNYQLAIRNADTSCDEQLGSYYIGCNEGNLIQVGDAIYTCQPTNLDLTTLAIDRIQPLGDFYNEGIFFSDVSSMLQTKATTWTTLDLGGPVYGVTFDDDFNIYTGISILYEIITPVVSSDLIVIDAVTGTPSVLATLPGNSGLGQVEYASDCNQLFTTNLEDGMIYRFDKMGNLLSTFDPLAPDDGVTGLVALGERVIALSYNPVDTRLYYSVWSNDRINNGTRNQIRSVQINPATCDFMPGTDMLEVNMPFLSETENTTRNFSHPVLDIEFDETGTMMIIGESGFDSTIPISFSHQSRVLMFTGSTGSWVLDNTVPTGNQDYRFQIGTQSDGTNSLGGVDFAYSGIGAGGCTEDQGTFIAAVGDALTGVDCAFGGCLYGIQYLPIEGANPTNSVLLDLARAPDTQQKGFYGDLDIVTGCCPCACMSFDGEVTATEEELCPGDMTTLCVDSDNPNPSYLWDDGSTTRCITVSPDGTTTYSVEVSNAGCSDTHSLEIQVSEQIVFSTEVTDVNSCEMANGSIIISASGGTPPLEFSINGGATIQSSAEFLNVMAGSYMIEVSDDFGCLVEDRVEVEGPGTLSLIIIADDQTNCNFPNGGISVSVTGGTPPYSYSLDGGITFTDSSDFVNLDGGMYSVVVEDDFGCMMMEVVELGLPACFGTVGNLIFEDSNGNGNQDPGEPGIADVTVDLVNTNDVILDRTISDINGNYLFEQVPEGDYYVRFTYPDNYEVTVPFSSSNTETDSNVDNSNGFNTTPIFSLSANETNLSIDLGLFECAQVGEFVWFDFNENDVFDEGESGINGVRVEIFRNIDGDFFLEDFTFTSNHPDTPSDDGYYKFCVPPGVYYVRVGAVPSAFVRAVPNQGFNEAIDSDITDRFGRNTTDQFTLTSGEDMCELDGGFYLEGAISSFCWHDDNLDGLRDDNEPPMEGLVVLAMNEEGDILASAISDENGQYRLGQLPKDYYYVEALLDNSYRPTSANAGSDDSIDSDLDGTFGNNTSRLYLVSPGEVVDNIGIGVALSSLPVEWLSLLAEAKLDYNEIVWKVASEINVLKYIVEYSRNNTIDFQPIGEVPSEHINSQEILTYTWQDDAYKTGTNYYRIKQIDVDGRFTYSDIVAVSNRMEPGTLESQLNVYPNPTNGWIHLSLSSELIEDSYEVKILDYLGRVLRSESIDSDALLNVYKMDLSEFNEGLYSVQLSVGGVDLTKRLFLTK